MLAVGAIGHNSAGRIQCIFRAHGDRGYTKLRNAFLQDRNISDETRGLVARLLSLPDDWEVTVQSIIASGKAGRDKVYRMIKEAEEHGYIRPEQGRKVAGKFDRQVYLVSDDPAALIEKAAMEIMEIEATMQPLPENPEAVGSVAEQQVSPLPALPLTAEPFTEEPLTAEPLTANPQGTKEYSYINNPPIVPPAEPAPKRKREAVPDEYPHDFEEFWKVYPRREGKAAALKAWQRLKLPQKRRAYVALKAQLPGLQARARDPRGNFCPHAQTWINQGRFDDDLGQIGEVERKPEGMPDFIWERAQAAKREAAAR